MQHPVLTSALLTWLICEVGSMKRVPIVGPNRLVRTTEGLVRGYFRAKPSHHAFLGVPYAKPPLGGLRFKDPVPPDPWDGIYEATHQIKCPQADGTGEENCLVTNIFSPTNASMLPVLFYVHGGNFQKGWGLHQGPRKFLNLQYVIVTVNFRLGIFGFLNLMNDRAPGNVGIKDILAAIYWTRENISNFGGSPTMITLYGVNSGAVAVEVLILSTALNGLVDRVILETGSILSPSTLQDKCVGVAYSTAINLGYDSKETEDLDLFFRRLPRKELNMITKNFTISIERHSKSSLIDKDPLMIFKGSFQLDIPIMISYTDADLSSMIKTNDKLFGNAPDFDSILPDNLIFDNAENKEVVTDAVKFIYFQGDADMPQMYNEYLSDVLIEYPVLKLALLLAAKNKAPIFVMKFGKNDDNYKIRNAGPNSGDLLIYKKVSLQMQQTLESLEALWRNFIKFGDPTPIATSLIPIIWEPVQKASSEYEGLQKIPILEAESLKIVTKKSNLQRLLFWNRVYNKFYKLN